PLIVVTPPADHYPPLVWSPRGDQSGDGFPAVRSPMLTIGVTHRSTTPPLSIGALYFLDADHADVGVQGNAADGFDDVGDVRAGHRRSRSCPAVGCAGRLIPAGQ